MAAREESVESLSSIAWPLAVSVVAIIWAMFFLCQFELGSTLSWRAVFIFPMVCVAVAACFHSLAVVVTRGIQDRPEDVATWPLLYGTWIPVVWLPSLVALGKDRSPWVAVVLLLMAVFTTALLHRWAPSAENQDPFEGDLQSLFVVPSEATLTQTIFPLLLTSLAAQLGLVAFNLGRGWTSGLLLALACLLPVWRFPRRTSSAFGKRATAPIASSVAALLVMMIALLPFLKAGPGHRALESLLRMAQLENSKASFRPPPPGAGYSGVILILPPKPPQAVRPPAPDSDQAAGKAKTQIIPFDGAYWYFKEPDDRPRPDARTVRGDPLKAHIQSTNRLALLMEAHQTIVPAVKMSCCSALRLNVINADTRPGSIAIEVILRDTESKVHAPVSLGTIVLPSSTVDTMDFKRQPVHESLTFRFPRDARAGQFSEITLKIKAAPERALAASQVSVESFVLVP
jgi:hypothetical protein